MEFSKATIWFAMSWAVVAVFLAVGSWWLFHIPTVGKGGLLLAVGATLMPLFWERAGVFGKMAWIAMIFVMLAVEYRAIDKDRGDSVTAESIRATAEAMQFSTIANDLRTSIQNSQEQFAKTMDRANAILENTMGGTSYPSFVATFPSDPASKEMSVFVITPGKSWPHGHIPTPEETAPLPDVTVDVAERPLKVEEMTASELESLMHPTHYNLGTLVVPGMFTAPFKLQKGKRYTLQITTRRGEFREDIYIDQDASTVGGWRESSCFYGRRTVYTHGAVTSREQLLSGKCN